jgi:hypothetical protein
MTLMMSMVSMASMGSRGSRGYRQYRWSRGGPRYGRLGLGQSDPPAQRSSVILAQKTQSTTTDSQREECLEGVRG